jgi:hypothetical protein
MFLIPGEKGKEFRSFFKAAMPSPLRSVEKKKNRGTEGYCRPKQNVINKFCVSGCKNDNFEREDHSVLSLFLSL